MLEQTRGFEAWAVVEILGHKQAAGRVTEEEIAGSKFLRVDVPENNGFAAYTTYYGASSVYAIHPCAEEYARQAAAQLGRYSTPLPVSIPDLAEAKAILQQAGRLRDSQAAPPQLAPAYGDEDDWSDDEGPF